MEQGFRLDKYQIVKRLAKGGMAEIFLARALGVPGFQRMVVVKRILPMLASNPVFVDMFVNEARIASTLQHSNLVQIYDVGVMDGNYFIAMEYLHGQDLRSLQRILVEKHQPLPLEHAIQIVVGICAGLHYAHEKVGFDGQPLSIVHRDVSPQNVIVTFDGGVKLLDFGVAKAASNANETVNGVVKGKIPYMSPEQCRGRPLDRRSDVYSVGIILYELTLGRRLYYGGTEFEMLKRIVERPVTPPRTIDREYDERLERIVIRALAKDPNRRFQTARAMQLELEKLARERGHYLSTISLQKFMLEVFGPRPEAWRDAPPLLEIREPSIRIVIEPTPVLRSRVLSRLWLMGPILFICLLTIAAVSWGRSVRARKALESARAGVASNSATMPTFMELPASSGVMSPPLPFPVVAEISPRSSPRAAPLGDGKLVLASRPWCEVTIDGGPRGPTPLTVRLGAGRHSVRVTNPAFHVDSTFAIQIRPRQTMRRSLSFATPGK
jgi:serine/threonine protein kinase